MSKIKKTLKKVFQIPYIKPYKKITNQDDIDQTIYYEYIEGNTDFGNLLNVEIFKEFKSDYHVEIGLLSYTQQKIKFILQG